MSETEQNKEPEVPGVEAGDIDKNQAEQYICFALEHMAMEGADSSVMNRLQEIGNNLDEGAITPEAARQEVFKLTGVSLELMRKPEEAKDEKKKAQEFISVILSNMSERKVSEEKLDSVLEILHSLNKDEITPDMATLKASNLWK